MSLQKPFISFSGEPIPGTSPARMVVHADADVFLSPQQEGWVDRAYRLFKLQQQVSIAEYHVNNRILPDGSRVMIRSFIGVDTIDVWPVPAAFDEGLLGGFAFWRADGETPFENTSRLSTQPHHALDDLPVDDPRYQEDWIRKYRFFANSDQNYGQGTWHGHDVWRLKRGSTRPQDTPLALSWDAGTAYWKLEPFSLPSSTTKIDKLEITEGYAGISGIGTGGKVYAKSRVVLDLTDEDLEEIDGDIMVDDLTTMTVQGAGMTNEHMHVVVASGLSGVCIDPPDSILYKLYFLRFAYTIQRVGKNTRFSISKKYKVMAVLDNQWIQDRKVDAELAAEEEFPPMYVADFRPEQAENKLVICPVSLWHFNASGTKSRCTFQNSDLLRKSVFVIEFDSENGVSPLSFQYQRFWMFHPDGDYELIPGGIVLKYPARSGTVTISGPADDGITQATSVHDVGTGSGLRAAVSEYTPFDPTDHGMMMLSKFDGDVPVWVELVSPVRNRVSSMDVTPSRSTSESNDWNETGTRSTTFNHEEWIVFYRMMYDELTGEEAGKTEVARFLWGEIKTSNTFTYDAGVTTISGAPDFKRFPGKVLFIDPITASAAWIELRFEMHMFSTYATPVGIDFSISGFRIEKAQYALAPDKFVVGFYLREINRGVEETPKKLLSREYPVTADPVTYTGYSATGYTGPTPSVVNTSSAEVAPAIQGEDEHVKWEMYFTDAVKRYHDTNFSLATDLTEGHAVRDYVRTGSTFGGCATYYDALLYSILPGALTEIDVLLSVETGTMVETIEDPFPDPVNHLTDDAFVSKAGLEEADNPCAVKIGIF